MARKTYSQYRLTLMQGERNMLEALKKSRKEFSLMDVTDIAHYILKNGLVDEMKKEENAVSGFLSDKVLTTLYLNGCDNILG